MTIKITNDQSYIKVRRPDQHCWEVSFDNGYIGVLWRAEKLFNIMKATAEDRHQYDKPQPNLQD